MQRLLVHLVMLEDKMSGIVQRDIWLDAVANTCSKTLEQLEKKVQLTGEISQYDEKMGNICMAYLYLLGVCDAEQIFDHSEGFTDMVDQIYNKTKTIH